LGLWIRVPNPNPNLELYGTHYPLKTKMALKKNFKETEVYSRGLQASSGTSKSFLEVKKKYFEPAEVFLFFVTHL
jgi:hypothetical protein